MRSTIIALLAVVLACPAGAQNIEIPNVLDGQLRYGCGPLQRDLSQPGLTVRPDADVAERGFAVFEVASLPDDYELANLVFTVSVQFPGTFLVALYGSMDQEFDWDFDLQKPLAFVDAVDVGLGTATLQLDVSTALEKVLASRPTFVIATFYVRTGAAGASLGIYSNENSAGAGPRLVFDGAVPATGESIGSVRSLFR